MTELISQAGATDGAHLSSIFTPLPATHNHLLSAISLLDRTSVQKQQQKKVLRSSKKQIISTLLKSS